VSITYLIPDGIFKKAEIKKALTFILGTFFSWEEKPLYLIDNESSFRIQTKISENNDHRNLVRDYNICQVHYRIGPAGNCGMIEIGLYGGIPYFAKYFLDFIEYRCREYNRSAIIGNDRLNGNTWTLVKDHGANWNFQECTWNINYRDPSHKIGLLWKNIAEYDYSGDQFGLTGKYYACNPDNGRVRPGTSVAGL